MRQVVLLWFVVLSFTTVNAGEILRGKVTNVIDGNTFQLVTDEGEQFDIILFGVDCPEPGQPFAEEAKELLAKMILKKKIEVSIEGKNRWGMRMGIVLGGKSDPREILLSEGLAWTEERNPAQDLEQLRQKAINNKKGIWVEEAPVPPWIFRRQQSMLQAKSS